MRRSHLFVLALVATLLRTPRLHAQQASIEVTAVVLPAPARLVSPTAALARPLDAPARGVVRGRGLIWRWEVLDGEDAAHERVPAGPDVALPRRRLLVEIVAIDA